MLVHVRGAGEEAQGGGARKRENGTEIQGNFIENDSCRLYFDSNSYII